ncbi:hypothetical protein Forpe1208_v004389 [Fusarium oxysporum f. sp. rapae]|uniref:Uncharacterized protein n=1 Tax=Fusarium oxysporum f. sp. rapae TaxID=485398 RepID=A0A8J5P385_FUSOX|nr:hypothetical protein Forpe1208_v004389 [Fusarium oxysporum f. sp. rapae]
MFEENQLFWKAYASTVKNIMVSGPVGDNTTVYIAAANTAGISGGKDIPAVCTNWGIYQYADFLLDPTNPNFVASKVSRYSGALNMTLQTLTPGACGDNSPDAWDRLNKAKERLAILRSELDDAKKQAIQDFKDDDNPDKPKSFAQEAATNEVQMKTNAIGGVGSALFAEAMKSAANGSNTLTELKGYNMKASIQSVTYDAAGKPILPDPLETQYVGFSNKKPDEFGISLSTSQQSSFKDVGSTEAQGSASFSRVPVFDFYASGGGRVEHSNFNMSSNAKDVKVALKIQHYKTAPFEPGSWNVDVKSLMAKLGAKLPAMFQKASAVTPRRLLTRTTRRRFKSGGGISVFGFRISSSGSSSEENEFHGNTWDSSSGVLNVNAENSRGSANVLAVMGEIVSA